MSKESYVSVCIDPVTHKYRYIPASSVVISVNNDGTEYTVKNLLDDMVVMNNKINNIDEHYNDLVAKHNALKAAYKANSAKTAMQLLDVKENN